MKGLLMKDFYNLRVSLKTTLIIIVIFITYLIVRNYEIALPLIPVLLSSSLLTTVINMDKHTKWNMLMITAPFQRKVLVQEKYLLLILLNIGGALIGAVVSMPFIISGLLKMVSYFDMTLLGWSVALLQGTIFLTYTYLFDKNLLEKLEIMMVISYAVSFAVILPIYFWVPSHFETENHNLVITHTVLFVMILFFYGALQQISIKKNLRSEQI